jgi:DNA-binding NtrC family response regulator
LSQKILIADDEEATRDILKAELSRRGYEIALAADGEEAMKIIGLNKFDLALVDIKMPKADGIQVLKYIQKSSPKTKAIIMTGFADLQIAMEAKQFGAIDFLSKPFTLEELDATIETALK